MDKRCTDLVDNHGNLIYEDDIVLWYSGSRVIPTYEGFSNLFYALQITFCQQGNRIEWHLGHLHNLWGNGDVQIINDIDKSLITTIERQCYLFYNHDGQLAKYDPKIHDAHYEENQKALDRSVFEFLFKDILPCQKID